MLAFEEVSSAKIPSQYGHKHDSSISSTIHARSQSQPISHAVLPPTSSTFAKRARAPSDPFIDASPSVARTPVSSTGEEPLGGSGMNDDMISRMGGGGDPFDDSDQDEYMRTWSSPDLTNPELLELLKLFPPFVSRRPLPRFPNSSGGRQPDIEEGEGDVEARQIRFGTGSMWVSSNQRSEGWEGSWWTRFVLWWKRLFSC